MTSESKERIRQWVITAAVLAGNLAGWLITTNVPRLVAHRREILLGRYAVGHLTVLLVVLPISVLGLILTWTKRENRRARGRQFLAMTISVLLAGFVLDLGLRLTKSKVYVPDGEIFHREPNTTISGDTRDVPLTKYGYPNAQGGYPDFSYTLTVDGRGFRNRQAVSECDVLTLGDSFTEGSEVSDDQAWPALLAERTGKVVYNLGMAGGTPRTYLASLKAIGVGLKPKCAVVMIYEGNDFLPGAAKREKTWWDKVGRYRKQSPVLTALKVGMIRVLGPMGARRMENLPEGHPYWPVAWLPMPVPAGPEAKYYAFKIKRLQGHWLTGEQFQKSAAYLATIESLAEINTLCRANNIRLVVLYAPDKPHVVLPLARQRLLARQVRAFLAYREKSLPPADEFIGELIKRLDTRESALAEFCRAASIEFCSLTRPLQESMQAGEQVYFTYDQHWTPIGNRVTADVVAKLFDDGHVGGADSGQDRPGSGAGM